MIGAIVIAKHFYRHKCFHHENPHVEKGTPENDSKKNSNSSYDESQRKCKNNYEKDEMDKLEIHSVQVPLTFKEKTARDCIIDLIGKFR